MSLSKMGGKKNGMELYFFWSIVAMSLPKMRGKKKWLPKSGEEFKKKKKCYLNNIFRIFSQQITSY